MNTIEILLRAASDESQLIRVWGVAQKAFSQSRISFGELCVVQSRIKLVEPNFFIPNN